MTPDRPSWPPSDEEIDHRSVVALANLLRMKPDATDTEMTVWMIRDAMTYFTPPAPEVASEELRASAREAGEVSDDDKRRLVEEVQRKWSIDGGASERDSPLSFARECIDAALARFAAPRGRVVEGYAWEERGRIKFCAAMTNGQVGSLISAGYKPEKAAITILDAPPRGEEE